MSFNYKVYRTALQTASPPIVPYLGLFPKDITSLEEMPTKVENDMINFSKFRELHNIINQMSKFTSIKYKPERTPDLMNFLMCILVPWLFLTECSDVKPFPEKKMMELSELYEPRQRRPTNAETPAALSPGAKEEAKTIKKLTPEQVEEYKRLAIEKYEQQQKEAANLLQLRAQIAKTTENEEEDEEAYLNPSMTSSSSVEQSLSTAPVTRARSLTGTSIMIDLTAFSRRRKTFPQCSTESFSCQRTLEEQLCSNRSNDS